VLGLHHVPRSDRYRKCDKAPTKEDDTAPSLTGVTLPHNFFESDTTTLVYCHSLTCVYADPPAGNP
jgi:hypothetical protein